MKNKSKPATINFSFENFPRIATWGLEYRMVDTMSIAIKTKTEIVIISKIELWEKLIGKSATKTPAMGDGRPVKKLGSWAAVNLAKR